MRFEGLGLRVEPCRLPQGSRWGLGAEGCGAAAASCGCEFLVGEMGRVKNEVSRGNKMALRGTDPESYITEYTLVYEDNARQDMGTAERDLSTHVMWGMTMGTGRV